VRLKVLTEHDPAARALIDNAVELTPEGPDYGRLRFTEAGRCTLLEPSGLCGIHARFGHEALFDVCLTYPRYFNRVDDDVELYGSLSCPEVARLALLVDDGFEPEQALLTDEPRIFRNRFATDKPYFAPYRQVREALLRLLREPGYGFDEKLFVLLWGSEKLRPVLHAGTQSIVMGDLQAALDALAEPQVLSALTSSFRGLALEAGLARSVLVQVLGGEDAAGAGLPAEAAARVEVCLGRFAQNHLLTTPYMLYENLFEFARDLVLRVAMLRFLLEQRLASFTGTAAELDQQIIAVTFAFVRRVEHSSILAQLRRLLDEQGMSSFAHSVCFLGR
jgi:lysine-N-methylase